MYINLDTVEKVEAFSQMNNALGVVKFYADMLGITNPADEIADLRAALTAAQEEAQRTRDELGSLQEYRAELAKNYAQAMVDNVGLQAQNAKLREALTEIIENENAVGWKGGDTWNIAHAALEAK